DVSWANVVRFFTGDIVPYPLRAAETLDAASLAAFGAWLGELFSDEALPGAINTV
ncbi:MAG: hypothetical protein GWO02_01260, partial [Gammaproteobacteria bacterium]|nr:hypothetical protein [Gammaproteobacteria bacterium]